MPDSKVITGLLTEIRGGNAGARDRLVELIYPELRRLAQHFMNRERPGHSLNATALVHEAYLRIFEGEEIAWQNRAHFFGVAARLMRQILVDHARRVQAQKRGGGRIKLSLDELQAVPEELDQDLVAVDEALNELERLDARASQVIELRFFAGLSEKETAEVLGLSVSSLKRDWQFARAWLHDRLTDSGAPTL